MTQVVTVQTDFADLNQMTQGLMDRVHDTHVILTGPDDIPEGEWVQFAVLLHDGAPGFAGLGRCVRSVDNGDARQPHQRYDLVLDSLQFDQHGQDVFQYILMSRQAMQDPDAAGAYAEADADAYAEPAASEGYAEAASYAEAVPAEAVEPEPVSAQAVEDYAGEEEPTRIGWGQDAAGPEAAEEVQPPEAALMGSAEVVGSAEVDEAAVEDADAFVEEADTGAMSAEATQAGEPPAAMVERRFLYTDGLPIPEAPPRPTLDPSLRVTPAPRPMTPSTAPRMPEDGIDPYETARAANTAASVQDVDDDDVAMIVSEAPPNGTDNGLASADEGHEPSEEPREARAVELEDDNTTSP